MQDLLDTTTAVDVIDTDYNLPPWALKPRLLRLGLLAMAESFGDIAVPLHPVTTSCCDPQCKDPLRDDPLFPYPVGLPDNALARITKSALSEAITKSAVDLQALATFFGEELGEADAVIQLRLVEADTDSCGQRRWLVFPEPARSLVAAFASCATMPDNKEIIDPRTTPEELAQRVEALDPAGKLQFSILSPNPQDLLKEALAGDDQAPISDDVPFDIAWVELGSTLSIYAPPSFLSPRISAAYEQGVWEPDDLDDIVSVTAVVEDESIHRLWRVCLITEPPCGHETVHQVIVDDDGLFDPRVYKSEDGFAQRPWNWIPEADQELSIELALWAATLTQADNPDPGWEETGPVHKVTGVVDEVDLFANPLDGTRYWRLGLEVHFACPATGCPKEAFCVDMPLTIFAKWAGTPLRQGDVVTVTGRVVASVSPYESITIDDIMGDDESEY